MALSHCHGSGVQKMRAVEKHRTPRGTLVRLLDRLVRQLRGSKGGKSPESVAARFVRLFEAHGVHRNQIARLFGRGLTLATVQTEGALLTVLGLQQSTART